jgi:hypothetical protein
MGDHNHRAEASDPFAKFQQSPCDFVGITGDNHLIEEVVQTTFGVAHVRVAFPHREISPTSSQVKDIGYRPAKRALAGETARLSGTVRDKDVARHLPIRRPGLAAGSMGG